MPKNANTHRNAQFTRIMNVLQLLLNSGRPLTVREIHAKVTATAGEEIAERTIRRDLDAIEECFGHSLEVKEFEDDRGVKTRTFKARATIDVNKTLVLTPNELLALYFAKGALSPLRETALYQDLHGFFTKLDSLITPEGRRHLDAYAEEIHFEPTAAWSLKVSPEILDTLRAGCAEGQVLKVTYDSGQSGDRQVRHLGPQFLYFSKASLYLVAEDLSDPAHTIKTFAAPRIVECEMLDTPYESPKVDPERFFSGSFGIFRGTGPTAVSVRFVPPVAAFVSERKWHESQQIVRLQGGAVEIKFTVGVTPELVQWVLGFGPAAEVLSPPELRDKVVAAAAAVVAKYPGNDQAPPSRRKKAS